jgi:hypothetical protein
MLTLEKKKGLGWAGECVPVILPTHEKEIRRIEV